MLKLKTILVSKYFIFILSLFTTFYVVFFTKIKKYNSVYQNENSVVGVITKIKNKDQKITFEIKGKEKIIANFYTEEKANFSVGDEVKLNGMFYEASSNTIPNQFNYKNYLYLNKTYKLFKVQKITLIKKNNNLIYKIKNKLLIKIGNDSYKNLFIMGSKDFLNEDIYKSYQNTGISHLLAISGLHLSVLIFILKKLLFFLSEAIQNIIIIIILFIYLILIDIPPSFLRVVLFFTLNVINKKCSLHISNIKLLIYVAIIILLINPFYVYNISFLYSFSTSFGIMLSSKYLNHKYIINLLLVTIIATLFSLPITINLNYEINIISFFSNLLMVPFVSFIVYPLCLLSNIITCFNPIFNSSIRIMENIILFLDKISFTRIIIPKMNCLVVIIYYLLLFFIIYFNRKKLILVLLFYLFVFKYNYYFDRNIYIYYLDVGQGDSILLINKRHSRVILIDTGGNVNYQISENIIKFLKSISVGNIDEIILSHGDFDHMGEAINLVENFKVENVIFNCGEYNELEKELIKVLDKKRINYYSCIKELNIDKYKLEFLNTKEYDNENDNSNVIYFNYNNYKFLFMGDAGIEKEKDILDKYYLKDIDFLKVGHHGSNTSSSEYFIDKINPKYSLISVGKNNRYGHPKEEVLETLRNSKVYRTDLDGSIEIKLNKSGYKIRTCPP